MQQVGQDRKKLYILYNEIKNTKIPNVADNNRILNLIDNISELDAYYAGLALTASEGGKVSKTQLYDIELLKKSLNSIPSDTIKDKIALESCRAYLEIIEKIDNLLRKIANK